MKARAKRLPSAKPSTAKTPHACARPSPPRTAWRAWSEELAAQRAAAEQAAQEVADGQQQLQQLEENQQRSLHTLAQIDAALAHSEQLAGLTDAWQAYLPQLKQVMLVGGRLAKGREELPGLQAQVSQANAQLQSQRDSFELLFREAGAEPQALAEQIDLLGAMLQDNRKQQRVVEDLSRLHGREQELRHTLASLRERQQQAMQQRQQLIGQGTAAKAELEAAEQALALTRQLLERQRLARTSSVESCARNCATASPALFAAAPSIPSTSPKPCYRAWAAMTRPKKTPPAPRSRPSTTS